MANSGKFTIDDAFDLESEEEDQIRVYGSTTESVPLKGKAKYTQLEEEVKLTDDHDIPKETQDHHEGLLPTVKKAKAGILRTDSQGSLNSQSDAYSAVKTFPEKRWWRHPKVRENWKIVIASFCLLLIGISCFVAGIAIEVAESTAVQSTVFFIAGAICLIPGAYHVVYIYCAVKGKRGFSFYNLPVFR